MNQKRSTYDDCFEMQCCLESLLFNINDIFVRSHV